jgi:manganese-dependent inorganic pyrophosphatase
MMSGIISDTLFLNSPTTTALEGQLLDWLAPIAGIEPKKLAEIIFASGSVILSSSPEEVIRSDCKEYCEDSIRFSVSQIEELCFDNFIKHDEALVAALNAHRKAEGLSMSFLLVTDVNSQNSLLVACGEELILSHINYPQRGKSYIFEMAGVVSRKKQLMPYISGILKSSGFSGNA